MNSPRFTARPLKKLAAVGVDAMNAPVVISSLGAFGVRAAAPIVVPPSVGTLFIGSAHREMLRNGKQNETAEVITLSLTFDHRVVNGAGAANFVHEIKEQIEQFMIPAGETARRQVVRRRFCSPFARFGLPATAYTAQFGLRFSLKAPIPSRASAEARACI